MGNGGVSAESSQGQVLPSVTGHHVTEAPNGVGEFLFDGQLTRITRNADTSSTVGGTEYVQGFAGEKTHAMVQAAWRDQWTMPGGVLVSPYVAFGVTSPNMIAQAHMAARQLQVLHTPLRQSLRWM